MNRFNIGEKVQHKPLPNEHTHTIPSSYIAMLLSWLVSFFSKHFSTGRPLKRQRRGGKGTEKDSKRWRSVSYSGPAPASPLQQRRTPRLPVTPRPLGTHLSGALSLYFTVTGDILVSRCHDEMAPLPRRSLRRRN